MQKAKVACPKERTFAVSATWLEMFCEIPLPMPQYPFATLGPQTQISPT
jgi:hypothetical protein